MKEKIQVGVLKIGMFVSDLDRPWLDTPFLLQGFLIETDEEIAKLKYHCQYVIVDRLRSVEGEFKSDEPVKPGQPARGGAASGLRIYDDDKRKAARPPPSSILGTLKTIMKETFATRPNPGGGVTQTRIVTVQTVNPPRPRAPETQVYAHGITRDEALKLETEVVDMSGRTTWIHANNSCLVNCNKAGSYRRA